MSNKPIKAQDINSILLAARAVDMADPHYQLGALTFALVTLCSSYGLTKKAALKRIKMAFETPIKTVTVDKNEATH